MLPADRSWLAENGFDISHHTALKKVILNTWVSMNYDASSSWMLGTLSTITTGTVEIVNLDFDMYHEDSARSLEFLIGTIALHNHFERVDEILSRDNFANLSTILVSISVMTRVALVRTLGYTVTGERWTVWEQLIREKMPRAEERGILRCI